MKQADSEEDDFLPDPKFTPISNLAVTKKAKFKPPYKKGGKKDPTVEKRQHDKKKQDKPYFKIGDNHYLKRKV